MCMRDYMSFEWCIFEPTCIGLLEFRISTPFCGFLWQRLNLRQRLFLFFSVFPLVIVFSLCHNFFRRFCSRFFGFLSGQLLCVYNDFLFLPSHSSKCRIKC